MRLLLPLLPLLGLFACFSNSEGDDDDDSGGSGFGDAGFGGDAGGDGGNAGGEPEIMEPATPVFDADLADSSFDGEPGYWVASGDTSLRADMEDSSIQMLVELEGDVTDGGSLVVLSVQWTRSVYSDADNDYSYEGDGDGSQTFTVEGLDVDGDYLWGTLDGEIDLTDSLGGGTSSLSGLTVESWPRFGA